MLPRSLRLFFQLLFVQYVVLAERMYTSIVVLHMLAIRCDTGNE